MSFMDKFDAGYSPRLEGRAPTFRAVVREALSLGVTRIMLIRLPHTNAEAY